MTSFASAQKRKGRGRPVLRRGSGAGPAPTRSGAPLPRSGRSRCAADWPQARTGAPAAGGCRTSRLEVIRTWSRFFMSTSGSIDARSSGWYICCIASEYTRASGGPGPLDRRNGRRDRSPPPQLGRPEHEQPVDPGRPAGFRAPETRELVPRVDLVGSDPGQQVALGLGGGLPREARQRVLLAPGAPEIGRHVAEHEHDDRVVGEDGAKPAQHVPEEAAVARRAPAARRDGRRHRPVIHRGTRAAASSRRRSGWCEGTAGW